MSNRWELSLDPGSIRCANCEIKHGDAAPCIRETDPTEDYGHISWHSPACFLDDLKRVDKIHATNPDQWEFEVTKEPTNCSGCGIQIGLGLPVVRTKPDQPAPHRVHCSVGCFLLDLKAIRCPSVWLVESGDEHEGYQSVDCAHASETGAVACAERRARGMNYEKPKGWENMSHWKKGGKWISVNEKELDP
jgi:hypothetical protein